MVKTLPSKAGVVGSIPGQRAKIPRASWPKKNTENRNNIATNSINILKWSRSKKKSYFEDCVRRKSNKQIN